MKKRFFPIHSKKSTLILISAAMLVLFGCSDPSVSDVTTESSAVSEQSTLSSNITDETSDSNLPDSNSLTEQTRFDEFSNELFKEDLEKDPLSLHFMVRYPENYGIATPEMEFSEYSLEMLQDNSTKNTANLEKLYSFDTSKFTSDQLLTYRMLKDYLETDSLSHGLELCTQPLSALIGTQAKLPALLAEYTFYTRDDIDNYLKLLANIDTYFDQLATYEKQRAESGLALSDETIDRIIKSCKTYLIRPENNLLTETFATRLNDVEGLSDSEKATYKANHLAILKEHFIPAYTNLSKILESIKGSNTTTGGLCTYENGKEYYKYLVASLTGTDSSVDELKKRISKQLQSDLSEMNERLKESPELAKQMTDSDITLSDPDEILENLQSQIQSDFPALSDTSYTIKYIPESLKSVLSPAYFLLPPVDSEGENPIYISKESSSEQNLYTTLAHEGYPGHLYQYAYFSNRRSNPVRRLITSSGYNEGWGLYCDLYAYTFDNGLSEAVKPLMKCSEAANYGLYAFLDICIHYDGWDLDTTTDYLKSSYGFTDPEAAKEIYLSIVDNPGNYLKYYTGYLEIMTMRQKAEETLGTNFNIKDFHQFILDMDGASFRVIKPYFETWLMVKQTEF